MNRFRPLYIAALAVILLGILGVPIIGRSAPAQPEPIIHAQPAHTMSHLKYVLALVGTGSLSLAGLLMLAGPRS